MSISATGTMFRIIPPNRISPSRSLTGLRGFHFSSSNSTPRIKTLFTQPNLGHGPVNLYFSHPPKVSKSFFSSTPLSSIKIAKRSKIEAEREHALQQKLESDPGKVTTTSGMTPILDPKPRNTDTHNGSGDEPDMLRGLKSDLRTVKETFELNEVPREVLYIGFGGLVPYLGTSLSTLYLAWDINYSQENGIKYLISEETAGHLLHILEPLQVGLGAVILSFLGAVHWGLEMAEYGGKHSYKRYSLSILAPVIAWPTLLLPVNIALIAQFVGFTGMYFADSTATTKGWAPKWYMTYRFLLTFVVGASIVMTLVGRGQIGDRVSKLPGPAAYLQDLRDSQWENLQKEENERKMRVVRERMEEAEEARGGIEQDAAINVEKEEDGTDEDEDEKDNSEEKNSGDTKEETKEEKRSEGNKPGKQTRSEES